MDMEKKEYQRYIKIPSDICEKSYKSYLELISLKTKGGSARAYIEAMHFNGILSIVASKVIMNSYRLVGQLTYQEFQSQFDKYLPDVLYSNALSHRLDRIKLADYNKALSLCTENYNRLSMVILDRLSDKAIQIINTKSELRDYTDKTFNTFLYHRAVKISDLFAQLWSSSQTMVKLAFLWHYNTKERYAIELHVVNVFKEIILNSSETIKNVFLYSKFEDDINHVSIAFPMKDICLKLNVSELMARVVFPIQLMEEYHSFTERLSNYNQADQI